MNEERILLIFNFWLTTQIFILRLILAFDNFIFSRHMQLQKIERERVRAYKQELKEEMEKNYVQRKMQNAYETKRHQYDQNRLSQWLNKEDVRRLGERRQNEMMMKEQNSEMSVLKKSNASVYPEGREKTNSFNESICKSDIERMKRLKEDLRYQTSLNNQRDQMKKVNNEEEKNSERYEESKHLQRERELEQDSKRSYQGIKEKHAQNMKLYALHSQLMRDNDEYRKSEEKFIQSKNDFLSNLHRDQYTQRMKELKAAEETWKSQQKQTKEKRSQQKSHILLGDQLEKSIFRSLLHDDSYDKKMYGEELKTQMQEMNERKSQEMQYMKQKYQSMGVFGGEHDRERQYQIRYMDRKNPKRSRQQFLDESNVGESHNFDILLRKEGDIHSNLNHSLQETPRNLQKPLKTGPKVSYSGLQPHQLPKANGTNNNNSRISNMQASDIPSQQQLLPQRNPLYPAMILDQRPSVHSHPYAYSADKSRYYQ